MRCLLDAGGRECPVASHLGFRTADMHSPFGFMQACLELLDGAYIMSWVFVDPMRDDLAWDFGGMMGFLDTDSAI
jgi:hypothetical protein